MEASLQLWEPGPNDARPNVPGDLLRTVSTVAHHSLTFVTHGIFLMCIASLPLATIFRALVPPVADPQKNVVDHYHCITTMFC